jgi:putative peptidoglycan lipid II flippase
LLLGLRGRNYACRHTDVNTSRPEIKGIQLILENIQRQGEQIKSGRPNWLYFQLKIVFLRGRWLHSFVTKQELSMSNTPQNQEPVSPETISGGNTLLKSSSSVSSMTLLSRIFGLVRDLVFAQLIGAGAAADAFYVAFKIPNFFRRLFSEGAFNQAFIPVLGDYQTHRDKDEVRHLLSRVSGTLGLVLLLLTAFVVLLPEVFTTLFAFGFRDDPNKFSYASDMLQITFPYLLLISLTGMAGAVLNAYDRFAIPAFTPVLLNICLISAAFFVAPNMTVPAYGLAWGVLAAGVVQLLFQLPFLAQMHLLPWPRWGWQDSGVRRILLLMLPAIFGVSVSQINLLLDTLLASFLPTGSVSWLYYSDRLSELPLGVIGIAIATVILPNLSRQRFSEDPDEFSRTLDWALRIVFLIGLPAALALIVLSEPILATLFFYGAFDANDLAMASLSLKAYAAGLLAFMLVKVLAPGYFAQEDMKTPVRIGVIAMVSNMVLNLILVAWLYFVYQIGHVGLALATSLSAFINAWLLFRGLRKRKLYRPQPGATGLSWAGFAVRLALASALMVGLLFFWQAFWPDWSGWSAIERVWRLALICSSGLGLFLLCLLCSGMRARHLH